GEPPNHGQERELAAAIVGIVGLRYTRVRNAGMEIDRDIERLRPLENAPEPLLVEKCAGGEAIDQRAPEVQACDSSFKLVGGSLGIDRRQLGEACKPGRM